MAEQRMFDVTAEAYDKLMGRYLPILGRALADAAGVEPGMRVLDVGCGPGGLTRVLAERVGADAVAAIDPSPPFVAACRERNPGVDVRQGVAERLPFDDHAFDAALSSLVVGFMSDPVAGVGEMRRVTKPGGSIAVCFWNYDQMPTLKTFWAGVRAVDPSNSGELRRIGMRQGELVSVLQQAGVSDVQETTLTTSSSYVDFADWWSPFVAGVGPSGSFAASLPPDQHERLRQVCDELLGRPRAPFTLEAHAWCAYGRA